jgi:HSP20 family protein
MNMSRPAFPFHGIFASLQKEQEEALNAAQAESAAIPVPAQAPQSSPAVHVPAAIGPKATGQVAVDIYEQDGYYIIKAPIAGVRLSDLDIEISDNVITIRGNRQQSDPIAPESYYLQECFWGEFARSITLPFTIDPKKIKATFNKDSVLKILIPKEEKVKIVRITES